MHRKSMHARGVSFLGLAALLTASPAWATNGELSPEEPSRPGLHDRQQIDPDASVIQVPANGMLAVEALTRGGYLDTATIDPGIDGQAAPGEPSRPERHDWRRLDERVGILEQVTINGLLEVEAFHRNGYREADAKEKASDLLLATAAIDIHARLTDWASAHVLLLWEEGETEPVEVDETVISLGNSEKSPFFLNAGKMYLPFGAYESFMIQDPLTLELGETNDTALQLGFESAGFYGSVYASKSDVRKQGSDDSFNNFGAGVGYVRETDDWTIDFGLGYLRNLAASGSITALLKEGASGDSDESEVVDYVGGLNAYVRLVYGPLAFYSEYLAAVSDFSPGELGGDLAKPKAFHAELAYTTELFAKETTFAIGYQGTDQAVGLTLPEHRYLAAVSFTLAENLTWTLEFLHDRDYKSEEGGTDGKADMLTTQLAFSF
jgi:hypothetical protein